MLKHLRIKLICIVMVFVTVLLSAMLIAVVKFTSQNQKNETIRTMESIAENPMLLGSRSEGDSSLFPFFALQIGRFHEILASNGGYFDLSDPTVVQDLIQQAFDGEDSIGELEEYNLRYYRHMSRNQWVIVYADMEGENRITKRITTASIGIGAAALVLFFFLSLFLSKWAVKPVAKAWQEQRQFVSDASHELKTPLTVILTNAELMRDAEPERTPQLSANILTMARQMRGLVENLLDLARVDNGLTKAVWETVDLSQAIEDACLPFEPVFFEKELSLSGEIEPKIFVHGSETHLRHVAEIFLDNAQKYSAPGGETVVRLAKQGKGHCVLAVENPGDPITPRDLQNIFKRFYRVDEARCRDGSYGLGLPIAQGIAEMHHGKIWAASANGKNTFYLSLPTIS